MESLAFTPDTAVPTKTAEPGRLQRWVRNALFATLPFFGGDSAPAQTSPERADVPARVMIVQETPKIPGTLLEEQEKDPSLTEEGYLDLLAKTLTTPESLDRFLKTRMRYAWDSPNDDNPSQEGTVDTHGSYWQTPHETIRRAEKGKMLGDCEDYALLVQAILHQQGKNAHVVLPPQQGHAMCVWVEKDDDGQQYQGYRADENGVTSGNKRKTLTEAMQDATFYYPFHPYWIPVGRRVGPWWYVDVVSIHAFNPDLPTIARISGLELAALATLLGGSYATYRLVRRRRKGMRETWKEYLTTFRLY